MSICVINFPHFHPGARNKRVESFLWFILLQKRVPKLTKCFPYTCNHSCNQCFKPLLNEYHLQLLGYPLPLLTRISSTAFSWTSVLSTASKVAQSITWLGSFSVRKTMWFFRPWNAGGLFASCHLRSMDHRILFVTLGKLKYTLITK